MRSCTPELKQQRWPGTCLLMISMTVQDCSPSIACPPAWASFLNISLPGFLIYKADIILSVQLNVDGGEFRTMFVGRSISSYPQGINRRWNESVSHHFKSKNKTHRTLHQTALPQSRDSANSASFLRLHPISFILPLSSTPWLRVSFLYSESVAVFRRVQL